MFTRRKKALILLNTSSGTGRAASLTMEIIKRLAQRGYEPILYPIIPKTDLVSEMILPEYEDQLDMVVCSGGDGTLNHVVQSIMQMKNRPLLSYIPTGSTNDFAKGLSIPVDFEKALDMVFNGNPFQYDIGKFNDSYFNYIAAFGAFSAVSYATDQQLKNLLGHAAYILSAIGDFPEHLSYTCHMRIETNNEVTEGDYIFGAICSAFSVGGFPFFKDANVKLNDGKMELLLIRAPKTPVDLQETLNAILKGTMDHPSITFRQISKVSLHAESSIAWSLDGEYGGSYKDVTVEVQQQAVTIMSGIKGQGGN